MTKEVNYHIWNDEPIQSQYIAIVDFPDGSYINSSIGTVTIQKGDVVYIDHGRSFMEYTRSGKGPQAEFPFGKIKLEGVPASVILETSKSTKFINSTQEEFDALVKKQKERIENFIPAMKEEFVLKHLEKLEKDKASRLASEANRKVIVNNALGKMESYFSKPKL